MTAYDEQLNAIIDQRIRLHLERTRAVGTCVGRDTTGPIASVLFHGATVSVPVKVAGHVAGLREGMTCLLNKYGTEWVVIGAYSVPSLGQCDLLALASATSTSSTTYVDMIGMPSPTLVKYHDATALEVDFTATGFVNTGGQGARWGVRLTQSEGSAPYTPVDWDGPVIFFSTVNHLSSNSSFYITGVPSGTYAVQIRWRRTSGTVAIQSNAEDLFHLIIKETVRAASPYV